MVAMNSVSANSVLRIQILFLAACCLMLCLDLIHVTSWSKKTWALQLQVSRSDSREKEMGKEYHQLLSVSFQWKSFLFAFVLIVIVYSKIHTAKFF